MARELLYYLLVTLELVGNFVAGSLNYPCVDIRDSKIQYVNDDIRTRGFVCIDIVQCQADELSICVEQRLYISCTAMNWKSAYQYCSQRGGSLLSETSKDKLSQVDPDMLSSVTKHCKKFWLLGNQTALKPTSETSAPDNKSNLSKVTIQTTDSFTHTTVNLTLFISSDSSGSGLAVWIIIIIVLAVICVIIIAVVFVAFFYRRKKHNRRRKLVQNTGVIENHEILKPLTAQDTEAKNTTGKDIEANKVGDSSKYDIEELDNLKTNLETFENENFKNSGCPIPARTLVDAGFIYNGVRDQVKCNYCGIKLSNWESKDDPVTLHCKEASECRIVKTMIKDNPCVICKRAPSRILYEPCLHMVVCRKCHSTRGDNSTCPRQKCGQQVKNTITMNLYCAS